MKTKLIFSIALFLTIAAVAQSPNLGTAGAQFLQIPVGARAASMGGAFIGVANDATSVFWNPAGINEVGTNSAHFSYARWFEMFDFNAASFVHNAGDFGTLAASIIVFTMDKMEITTETKPEGTGRFFDAQDIAIGLTYGRKLTDQFSVGVTAKYVSQRIWNESATGVSFDIGTQYKLDFNNLTIAMSMTNFGPDLQYDGEDLNVTFDPSNQFPLNRLTPARLSTDPYPLPLTFQVGIAIDVVRTEFFKMRAAIDAIHQNDNDERVNAGVEMSFFDRLYLRGGYRGNYDDEDFTFGAGANLPLSGTLVSFDYSYALYDLLPSIHRISVGISF